MNYPLHFGEVFVRTPYSVLCDGSGNYHITQLVLYMELTNDMDEVAHVLHTTLFQLKLFSSLQKITDI